MQKIIVGLEQASIDASHATFDPELVFTNLRRSLTIATRSQRGELAYRLLGPLIELVDDQWAFTDAGLQSLTDDRFVPADVFPATIQRFQHPGTPAFRPPEPPDGVPEETWKVLMEIAETTYLGRSDRLSGRKGFVV